jgi:hypothetical protein
MSKKNKLFLHFDKHHGNPSYYRWNFIIEKYYNNIFSEIIHVDIIRDKNALDNLREKYEDGDYFLGRFGGAKCDFPVVSKMYPELINIFQDRIYPCEKDYYYYEDKKRQMELFEEKGYSIPKSKWITHIDELKNVTYPFIAKKTTGSGNSGVQLIKNKKDSRKRLFEIPFIMQEYIKNNATLRLIVIGDKIFGYKRINDPKNCLVLKSTYADFSYKMNKTLFDFVYKIYKDNDFISMSFDIVYNEENDKYYLLEISYTFACTYARKVNWYYDMKLQQYCKRPFISDIENKDYDTELYSQMQHYQLEEFVRRMKLID